MSFLAPLYIAGALAVALPILFHLIRRTPQGRQDFSSLMFLTTSPPTITRRSRLTNIVLLLLRAAALCLLALAFARPFLRRSADQSVTQSAGRRVALLVDTSASMRRGDLWAQAKRQVDKVLGELRPTDEVALYLFDRTVRPAVTFSESRETPDPARRSATIRGRLAEAEPTWFPTRLGDALATVADLLAESDSSSRADAKAAASIGRQIILVSDVQQGSHAEALQGHEWPANVLLDVRPVALSKSTNASLQLVRESNDPADKADARLRVRVTNQPDSAGEQFALNWADANGPLPGEPPVKVYVPPGRGQTVRVPWPNASAREADRLVLTGDDADFDDTLYVVAPPTETIRVVFVGEDAAEDTKGLLYYLRSAAAETARQKIEWVVRKPADPLTVVDLLDARLVVTAPSAAPSDTLRETLRRHAEGGGTVLWVLRTASAAPVPGLDVKEAAGRDFALIARVETAHPLFAPFADPRFADFTKIHFWHHRKVNPASLPGARVLAWFDDGDPFLVEQPVGRGRNLFATSGWNPSDSQLALSTKFVPLISGLLRRGGDADANVQYAVGDPLPVPQPKAGEAAGATAVIAPGGGRVELTAGSKMFDLADRPGVYRFVRPGGETPLAVNVPADESRTAPMPVEDLEHWGARLGSRPPSDELAARQRQLQIIELENRQKLWRWLIVSVLGLLAAETALAGLLARRAANQPGPQQVVTP